MAESEGRRTPGNGAPEHTRPQACCGASRMRGSDMLMSGAQKRRPGNAASGLSENLWWVMFPWRE